MKDLDNPDWIQKHEQASERVLEYEAGLQEQINDHMRRGDLLSAGILEFENADLLAMLKQSPAARRAAELALIMVQDEVEVTALALELLMEDAPFDPHIEIYEAKVELQDVITEKGYATIEAVRKLGLAYLGKAPAEHLERQKRWSRTMDGELGSMYLARTASQQVAIETEAGEQVIIAFTSTTYHDRRFAYGFQEAPRSSPFERLYAKQGDETVMLEVDIRSEMSADKMAEALLALPDEPVYAPHLPQYVSSL